MRPATTIVLAVILIALFGAAILQLVVFAGNAPDSVPGAPAKTTVSKQSTDTAVDSQAVAT